MRAICYFADTLPRRSGLGVMPGVIFMSDEYEEYQRECEVIRAENEKLIDEFFQWLSNKKLSEATCNKHCDNVDFYVNEFLLYDDATRAADGAGGIGMFLGYWFIRKAAWCTENAIKQNAVSLKKFYQLMLEKGEIDQESFDYLKERVKEDMAEWLATLRRYDDPSIRDPAKIWGL